MEIKFGVVTKPGSAQNIVAEKFKNILEKTSDKEISVHIFHSGSLGNETQILQKIQAGMVHMGIITGGPTEKFDHILSAINYPFLFKDYDHADSVLDGPLGDELLLSLEEEGFKGLAFSENGFRHLTNNKRPVKTPKDLQGLRIRVMDSPLHKTIWASFGAQAIPMPWPVIDDIKGGVIDGQENPLWVMDVYKLYEIQRYMTMTRHVYSAHICMASLQWWKDLDMRAQGLIQKAIRKAAIYQKKENREKGGYILQMLRDKGMEIEDKPAVELFRQSVKAIREMGFYRESKVRRELEKILEATRW